MRSPRVLAASTLAVAAFGGALADRAAAGDDDERDKNTLIAEAQFQLFLLNSDLEPNDITCTRPPLRDTAGEMLCYALVSDRISVAAIASMELPGIYVFTPLDKIDPSDLDRLGDDRTVPQPPPPTAAPPTTAPPAPEPPAAEPLGDTDQAIVDSIDAVVADSAGLGSVLTENNTAVRSLDHIAYHAPTSTVQVTVTTDGVDPAARDSVAFYVTDVMAYLWEETAPTRATDATIHPRLEVTVDDVIYGSAFDVMVQVADYTITEGEWIEIVTGNAALKTAF
jgi:hypothetical protein